MTNNHDPQLKTLADFNYDIDAFTAYLNSADAMNDSDIDVYVDVTTNSIYTPTDGDWTKGHGHRVVGTSYDRKPEDPKSRNRDWKNPW